MEWMPYRIVCKYGHMRAGGLLVARRWGKAIKSLALLFPKNY